MSNVTVTYPYVFFAAAPKNAIFKLVGHHDELYKKFGEGEASVAVCLRTMEQLDIKPKDSVVLVNVGGTEVSMEDINDGDFFLYQGSLYMCLVDDGYVYADSVGDPETDVETEATQYYKRLGGGIDLDIPHDTKVRRVNVNIEVVY